MKVITKILAALGLLTILLSGEISSANGLNKKNIFNVNVESNPYNPELLNNPLGKYEFGFDPNKIKNPYARYEFNYTPNYVPDSFQPGGSSF